MTNNESFEEFLEGLAITPIGHPDGHLPGITPILILPFPLLIIDLDVHLNLALLGLEHPHTQILPLLFQLHNLLRPHLHSLHEIWRSVLSRRRSEEIAIVEGEPIVLFFVGAWVGNNAQFVGVQKGFADLDHTGDQTDEFALHGAFELVVVFLVGGLGVLAADVDLDEHWVLVQEVHFLEDFLYVSHHHQVIAAPDFCQKDFECYIVDPLCGVVGASWR